MCELCQFLKTCPSLSLGFEGEDPAWRRMSRTDLALYAGCHHLLQSSLASLPSFPSLLSYHCHQPVRALPGVTVLGRPQHLSPCFLQSLPLCLSCLSQSGALLSIPPTTSRQSSANTQLSMSVRCSNHVSGFPRNSNVDVQAPWPS